MSNHILKINGVSKSFPGVKVLDNINLKIKKGEVVDIYPEKNQSFCNTVLEVKNLNSKIHNLSNISFSLNSWM